MELLQWAFNRSLSKAGEDIQTEHNPQQIPRSYPDLQNQDWGLRGGRWRGMERWGGEDISAIYF